VLPHAGADAHGQPRLECLPAGAWTRQALQGVAWVTADAATIAQDTAAEMLVKLRAGKAHGGHSTWSRIVSADVDDERGPG
jgi:hypothetical protein